MIVVVTAPEDRALQDHARGFGAQVAINPDPSQGMLSSLRAGIAAAGGAEQLARQGEVLLVAPADLPALRPATVAELLWRRASAGALLAVPTVHGRRGHPLALAPPLLTDIETLDLAVGLKQLLERHASAVLGVPVEDGGAVHDVDTPEDYAALTV